MSARPVTPRHRTAPALTDQQHRAAVRKARQLTGAQRLRRVRLECHGWARDPQAQVGDWLWCDPCADLRRVAEVAE